MILTVCLSPCIDVNIEVDSLSVGMSHKVISKRIFYTGKAINVAIGLARLNADVFSTGFMYKDNGNQFEHELHREGVPYKFVWNEGRVRENYKFIDYKSMLTEFNDISPEVSLEKQDELINLIGLISKECEAVIVSGSLAKGMTPDYYSRILSVVPQHVKKIVDTEGDRLVNSLKYNLDLIKPNLEEFERTIKRTCKNKSDVINGCKYFLDNGVKNILLSLGKKGAVLADGKKFYYCKSVNVAMNSTVGAGDGMLAAATQALVAGGDSIEILLRGVAAGTAAVTSPDSISFNKSKFDEIHSSLTIKEI